MKNDYNCSICNKEGIKLWRPYNGVKPLICAKCAEARQAPMKYPEVNWEKRTNGYIGIHTGKKLPLPKWTVDDNGQVPSYLGPGPNGFPRQMTYNLIVNLKDISTSYSSDETSMVPAIPDKYGELCGYSSIPKEAIEWWESLPTKLE